MSPSPSPMVSVLIITYNHERFIAQALDSVLMQETDFSYEIVIGEDCSTDQTGAIVAAYQRAHPERIRVLPRPRNLGMVANFADTYLACRGTYIAMLEGDDFWTDPHKLQHMVGFLRDNPDYAICFHRVRAFYDDGSQPDFLMPQRPPAPTSSVTDLLPFNYISTCSSAVFRRQFTAFPAWFFRLSVFDHALHILHAQHGLIHYEPEPRGCYRLHAGGVWSLQEVDKKKVAYATDFALILLHAYPYDYARERHILCEMYYTLAVRYAAYRNTRAALNALLHCLRHYPHRQTWGATPNPLQLGEVGLAVGLQAGFPQLYVALLSIRRMGFALRTRLRRGRR